MLDKIWNSNLFRSLVLTAVAAALASCSPASAQKTPEAPPPAAVTVAQPLIDQVDQWSEHTGRFLPAQSVDVRPRISGYLQAVHFREGQLVQKGQLLFTIDPLPFQAEVDRRKAEVAQAQARLSLAETQLKRAEALRAADAISQQELDGRKEAVDQAKAGLQAAEASLRADSLNLGYARVYAPISGRISDTPVDAGNMVRASDTVLTRIVALDPIHFEFSAPEALLSGSAPALAQGKSVAVKLEGDVDYVHQGRLDFVDNQIDPATSTIKVRALFRNDGRFTPGQYARIRVLTPAAAPSILLPDTAISSDQSRKYVLVVNASNVVEYRPVTLGPSVRGLRVVTEGLKGDERVVINGLQRAFPGAPVKPEPGKIEALAQSHSTAG